MCGPIPERLHLPRHIPYKWYDLKGDIDRGYIELLVLCHTQRTRGYQLRDGLRARHAKLSEASQQALEDMQMVVMRNEHDIKSLQQSHAVLQGDRSAAIEAHALASARLKDAESQISALKSQLDNANADVQSLKSSLSASDADRKALKLSLDKHKDSCMQVNHHHPALCSLHVPSHVRAPSTGH